MRDYKPEAVDIRLGGDFPAEKAKLIEDYKRLLTTAPQPPTPSPPTPPHHHGPAR